MQVKVIDAKGLKTIVKNQVYKVVKFYKNIRGSYTNNVYSRKRVKTLKEADVVLITRGCCNSDVLIKASRVKQLKTNYYDKKSGNISSTKQQKRTTKRG